MLEHMLFKGTTTIKPGEFSHKVAALGGRENAFTNKDYTGYYQQIPASRLQEVMQLEADRFGLNFAAMAGYNPREAIPFWQRMSAASQGQKPPEFLSTHPSDENRIAKLEALMPEALSYYKPIGK